MKHTLTLVLFLSFTTFAFAQMPEKELSFYENQLEQAGAKDYHFYDVLTYDLENWLQQNYALSSAEKALLLKAEVQQKNKKYVDSYLTLLRYVYEFPTKEKPQELLNNIIEEFSRNDREYLQKEFFVKVPPTMSIEERLSNYLGVANKLELDDSYEPLLKDYAMFLRRFPLYENKDKVELMLGDLFRQNENYSAAISQYAKVYEIYPSTKYKAAALRMKGDIYGGEMKDYEGAKNIYEEVLKVYPKSVEIPTVYEHYAILEEGHKNYDEAIDLATKSYNEYLKDNQKISAYNVLMFKSNIEEKRLKNYVAATKSLSMAADLVPTDEELYTDAKFKEASLYEDRLEDPYSYRSALEEIAIKFPETENGAKALFMAGEVSEDLEDYSKAKELYKKIIISSPASSYANKAQKRINSIEKDELKQAQKEAENKEKNKGKK